jgi:hypothetical protein
MARPAQKLRVDKELQELQARRLFEVPESLGLLTRQPQARLLQKLGIDALEQCIIDNGVAHHSLLENRSVL